MQNIPHQASYMQAKECESCTTSLSIVKYCKSTIFFLIFYLSSKSTIFYWWKHLSLSLSLWRKEHTTPKNLCLSSIHLITDLSHLQTHALVTKKCAWSFSLLMVGISRLWFGPSLWRTIQPYNHGHKQLSSCF